MRPFRDRLAMLGLSPRMRGNLRFLLFSVGSDVPDTTQRRVIAHGLRFLVLVHFLLRVGQFFAQTWDFVIFEEIRHELVRGTCRVAFTNRKIGA